MLVQHLVSVDGAIVFDVDPDVVGSTGGGTRVADGVDVDEIALLARAMTYEYAVFEIRRGGAGAGFRPRLLDQHHEAMARYVEEVRDLVESGRFLTGADLGTTPSDFASLRDPDGTPSVVNTTVDGVAFETMATGRGVAAAAAAWLGSTGLAGRSVAIEGFGAVAASVALAVVRGGGRVVAVSTVDGAVATNAGFDIAELVAAHADHGSRFVRELGLDVHPGIELHGLPVDVLVPGARTGVYTPEVAATVRATVIAPAAPVPYTVGGLDVLRARGVAALPDFVCNGGAVLGSNGPGGLSVTEALDRVERLIGERIEAARLARIDPFDYATTLAETFMATWIPAAHRPAGPALAP